MRPHSFTTLDAWDGARAGFTAYEATTDDAAAMVRELEALAGGKIVFAPSVTIAGLERVLPPGLSYVGCFCGVEVLAGAEASRFVDATVPRTASGAEIDV